VDLVNEFAIAVVGAAGAAVAAWVFFQFRRGSSFAITEAAATQLPWSAPTQTVLTVSFDRSHADARPKITAISILDAQRHTRQEFTFTGADAARIRDGRMTLADTENETITVEVLRDGQPGVFDLDGLYVEVAAGRSASKFAEIRVVDPG
jgi:hypothetical protein